MVPRCAEKTAPEMRNELIAPYPVGRAASRDNRGSLPAPIHLSCGPPCRRTSNIAKTCPISRPAERDPNSTCWPRPLYVARYIVPAVKVHPSERCLQHPEASRSPPIRSSYFGSELPCISSITARSPALLIISYIFAIVQWRSRLESNSIVHIPGLGLPVSSHHRHFPAGQARARPSPLLTVTVFSLLELELPSFHRHPGALRQIHPGAFRPE